MVNRHILIAAVIIGGSGVVNAWSGKGAKNASVTRILLGSYVLILVLSLVDLVPQLRPLASALAMLAVVSVLLSSGMWDALAGMFKQNVPTQGGGKPGMK